MLGYDTGRTPCKSHEYMLHWFCMCHTFHTFSHGDESKAPISDRLSSFLRQVCCDRFRFDRFVVTGFVSTEVSF